MKFDRRGFLGVSAAAIAAPMVKAAAPAKIVVVGGGAGGATAARQLAMSGGGDVEVTLIEPTRTYYSCFFSNLYLGGFRDFASLGHSYGGLATRGVNVVHDWAVDVDGGAVNLASGGAVPFDRLILSPGIDFVEGSVPGWDVTAQNAMPHAYRAGSQTELLKAQVEAMPEGGTFVMVAPPNPYRCPPGPYERVSMIAHQLKQTNPTAKIIIADPKAKFSKMALFEEGWAAHYSDMIEWIGPDFGGDKVSVDPTAMTVDVDGEVIKADICNVIPAMKAGLIAERAGVADETGWAPVHAADMSARANASIHILGDASAQGDMPKSGFSANSQAKACASAILAAVRGEDAPDPRFLNTCWSLIAPADGVKVGARYEATEEKIARVSGFVSDLGEDLATRKKTYEESLAWYEAITSDMFG
ncbi:MAG: NAD(P)/FAD-dependent oxidoreductase [Pseudomonadota bacterium]